MTQSTEKTIPTAEQRSNITRYESTYGLPRFVGVPRDDQLDEDSSMEGILHGRLISEVVGQDSRELSEAKINWKQGVHVLQCLAVAGGYQYLVEDRAYDALRQQIFNGKKFWDASNDERKQYEIEAQKIPGLYSRLAGFGDSISAFATGARVQVEDPISDTTPQGDGTVFDHIASEAPERKIVFKDGSGEFTTTVNGQTLLQAEAYHLLEKGNQYALTGSQLARIVASFDETEFHRQLDPWLNSMQQDIMSGLSAVMSHHEQIDFTDGISIDFSVLRRGTLSFVFSKEPFCRLYISQENGKITGFELNGEDYHNGVSVICQNGNFYKKNEDYNNPSTQLIGHDHPLSNLVAAAEQLHQTAVSGPDGILQKNSQLIHHLAPQVMSIANPE